jgi:ABC-type multidrug transport system fused ATPase/permease subunit
LENVGVFSFALLRAGPCFQRAYIAFSQVKFGWRTVEEFNSIENTFKKNNESSGTIYQFNGPDIKLNLAKISAPHISFSQPEIILRVGINIIMGNSGVGKSTILRYFASNLHNNNENFCYVSQQTDIFQGSLQENILLGRYHLKDEMNKLIYEYFSEDEINRFNRLNQVGGDEAINNELVSGGQVQRIAITRALISDPKVIIFDETFANIHDKLCEKIISSLHEKSKKMNLIVAIVSHRPFNFNTILIS